MIRKVSARKYIIRNGNKFASEICFFLRFLGLFIFILAYV